MSDLDARCIAPPQKACAVCGGVFSQKKDEGPKRFSDRQFCSTECGYVGRRPARWNTAESFYEQSIPEPNSGCWLWTGPVSRGGYGKVFYQGRGYKAHRLSLILSIGSRGCAHALHTCDTPSCINPDHLYSGTHQQNMADMKHRGRRLGKRGGKHANRS